MGSNGFIRCFFIGNADDEKLRQFLDSCNFCSKRLPPDSDIFMYRGDTPFCSEECRQERINMDEAADIKAQARNKLSSATVKVASSSSSTVRNQQKSGQERFRTGGIVAG